MPMSPYQIDRRAAIDAAILDPANSGKTHLLLAEELGVGRALIRIRRHLLLGTTPRRRGPATPVAPAPKLDPPAVADHTSAAPSPAAPVEPAAERCRRYLREFREVRRRHRRIDWRVPAPAGAEALFAPEPKEYAHAS